MRIPGLFGQGQARTLGVPPVQCRRRAELLDALGPGAPAEVRDQPPALFTVGRREPDFHELMVVQGAVEFADDGLREAALAKAYNGFAAMGLSTEESDLGTAEHRGDRSGENGVSLARDAHDALASIKRELAAIILVAAIGAPLVMHWLEGVRELAVLGAYGVGAGLWVHTRARGLLLALRQARRAERRDGA